MKRAVSTVTIVNILFILLLSIAASFEEPYNTLIKLVGIGLMAYLAYRVSVRQRAEREAAAGVKEKSDRLLSLTRDGIKLLVPIAIPAVLLIFLLANLLSFLFNLVGAPVPTVGIKPLPMMLLMHCLIPTIVEETVFRYIPMKLIAPYSKRWCAILSALFFALAHLSLYQMPYAFVAGIIFMTVNLATESMLPSIILHLLNNAVSVLYTLYGTDSTFLLYFGIIFGALALISLVFVIIRFSEYKRAARLVFTEGEPLTSSYAPVVFTAFTLILAVLNLFS